MASQHPTVLRPGGPWVGGGSGREGFAQLPPYVQRRDRPSAVPMSLGRSLRQPDGGHMGHRPALSIKGWSSARDPQPAPHGCRPAAGSRAAQTRAGELVCWE